MKIDALRAPFRRLYPSLSPGIIFVLVCAAHSTIAQAAPITGGITFGGSTSLSQSGPTSTLASSSQAVQSVSQTFLPVPLGTLATFSSLTFVSGVASPTIPLWSFTSSASTYSFNLLTTSSFSQTASTINASGTGVMQINGPGALNPTAYNWTIIANQVSNPVTDGPSPNLYNITAIFGPLAVPEGGVSNMVLLLGAVGVLLGVKSKLPRVS